MKKLPKKLRKLKLSLLAKEQRVALLFNHLIVDENPTEEEMQEEFEKLVDEEEKRSGIGRPSRGLTLEILVEEYKADLEKYKNGTLETTPKKVGFKHNLRKIQETGPTKFDLERRIEDFIREPPSDSEKKVYEKEGFTKEESKKIREEVKKKQEGGSNNDKRRHKWNRKFKTGGKDEAALYTSPETDQRTFQISQSNIGINRDEDKLSHKSKRATRIHKSHDRPIYEKDKKTEKDVKFWKDQCTIYVRIQCICLDEIKGFVNKQQIKVMGIQGLLQALKQIQVRTHISKYKGQKVAVDGYCWLHKGVYACTYELGKGMQTRKYIQYCVKRIDMLLEAGVVPIVVFDGAPLPMKKEVEETRAKTREENKKGAQDLWREGDAKKAQKLLARGIDVTPEMASQFIEVLKKKHVEYIVAPYEADAQMAFLFLRSYVSLVITEDSDLLAFGCRKALFKMDNDGYGDMIDMDQLQEITEFAMLGFEQDNFLRTCILSGCDYLDSIKGIGFKTALRYVTAANNLDKIITTIIRENKFIVPQNYKENFEKAFLTFKFQTVFDPSTKCLTFLNPIEGTVYEEIKGYPDKDFLGPQELDSKIMKQTL
eukprot:TRINITY_DN619_c0_g1_i1.p3 TRINITY_DN619_c0_g1~~TRINITY_DN619_c0_g1_i1.p3  ORF type:complete len:597 (-),score=73.13 TRINITY_DN619_c0_g1_i1:1829-3619(-)